jgi:hypothetical protein
MYELTTDPDVYIRRSSNNRQDTETSLSVYSEISECGVILLGHFTLGQGFFMFRKGKDWQKTKLCMPLICLDKFHVRSKINLVTNISAKLNFMNLYETELYVCIIHQQI